jgi:hypothetical protein
VSNQLYAYPIRNAMRIAVARETALGSIASVRESGIASLTALSPGAPRSGGPAPPEFAQTV